MIPIHELLSRIRWDRDFGSAEFIICYRDRLENELVRVPLKHLHFDQDDHFDFELSDDRGERRSIPLHRIREVYRNGELIWHREGGD